MKQAQYRIYIGSTQVSDAVSENGSKGNAYIGRT